MRFNPTCRSDRFRLDPRQISSESDIFHKKPIGSGGVFVGFPSIGIRPGFYRNSTEHHENSARSDRIFKVLHRIPIDRNPTKTPSDPISRESPGFIKNQGHSNTHCVPYYISSFVPFITPSEIPDTL